MAGLGKSKCWNCGSMKYYNTISTEECPSCGIKFEYHGNGANDKYKDAQALKHYREELEYEEFYGSR